MGRKYGCEADIFSLGLVYFVVLILKEHALSRVNDSNGQYPAEMVNDPNGQFYDSLEYTTPQPSPFALFHQSVSMIHFTALQRSCPTSVGLHFFESSRLHFIPSPLPLFISALLPLEYDIELSIFHPFDF